MRIYLVSNNLLLDYLNYALSDDLETIRLLRPLSIKGEEVAKLISERKEIKDILYIMASFQSGAIGTAKYLARKFELQIEMRKELNDCAVGMLGSKNIKMVKNLQDHDFTYRLPNGESLQDVGDRINTFITNNLNKDGNIVMFTHKRAILGFLLKYGKVGYNLEDDLILEYNDKIIYDGSETNYDLYELYFDTDGLKEINRL